MNSQNTHGPNMHGMNDNIDEIEHIISSSNYNALVNRIIGQVLNVRVENIQQEQQIMNQSLYEKSKFKNIISDKGKESLKRINIHPKY